MSVTSVDCPNGKLVTLSLTLRLSDSFRRVIVQHEDVLVAESKVFRRKKAQFEIVSQNVHDQPMSGQSFT